MLYLTSLLALGSLPAHADAGFGCGCNRGEPHPFPDDFTIPCSHLAEGSSCELDDSTTGVCDADGECVSGGSGTASRSHAPAGVALAGGLLLVIRRRR